MRRVATIAALVGLAAGVQLGTQGPADAQEPAPVVGDTVPRAKFDRAARLYHREVRKVRALRATLRHRPDFEVSLRLAGIAYGQDWRHLMRCALSEGARRAERHERHNRRTNREGSGATSSFQFMRGTFLSTPFAGLDWTRQDVQAFAAAWMWRAGRKNEWAGKGC